MISTLLMPQWIPYASTRGDRAGSIETVRGLGYRLSVN
jgi:hypothetical protein